MESKYFGEFYVDGKLILRDTDGSGFKCIDLKKFVKENFIISKTKEGYTQLSEEKALSFNKIYQQGYTQKEILEIAEEILKENITKVK